MTRATLAPMASRVPPPLPEPQTAKLPPSFAAAAPPQRPPLTAPNIAPPPTSTPFDFTAPAPTPFTGTAPTPTPFGAFTGTAPTVTPYGDFVAPDPTKVADSPYYKFRLDQGQKALERGAASRGTLLTGGLQARLAEFGQGMASAEADKDYQRMLDTYTTNRGTNAQNFGQNLQRFDAERLGYTTNRDTNAQNFGQAHTSFQDALAASQANAGTALSAGNLALNTATAGYDRNSDASRTAYTDAAADTLRRTGVANANTAATYQAQMDEYARQQEAARAATAAAVSSRRRGGVGG
jgi:hypothetical protein